MSSMLPLRSPSRTCASLRSLRRERPAVAPSGSGGVKRGARGPFRVLVADDDPEARAEIRRMLLRGSDRRYELLDVETAMATVEAVLHGPGGPPDCLVLDFHLPDADAPEVLAALVGSDGGCVCPVVVLTEEGAIGRAMIRAGAQDFLGKGWMTPDSVTRALDNAAERHRMARELRDRQTFYRQMLESIPGMVFTNAPDGACDYVNQQWGDFTGVPAVELLGRGWLTVVHPDDRARVLEAWQSALERAEPFAMECRVRRADGVHEWFKLRVRPIRDAGGAVARWFGVAANVDDLKQAEHALEQADRHKDEFLATLAHELRNPLAPIRTGLDLLRERGLDGESMRIRGMMARQLEHLIRMVDDLLDVARISRGVVELRLQRLMVRTIVEHAIETNGRLVEARGQRLVVRVPEEPLWVDGDLTRLAQVVGNLLNNATKYTPEGGCIELSVEVEGDQVVIRVADDGIGIAAETLPRVFDLFARVQSLPHQTAGGLGIGLSLIRKLVRLHGGSIEAESPGLGRGSTFTVRLPLGSREGAETTDAVGPPRERGAGPDLRVLVVDDNVDAAEMLCMLLKLRGHEPRAAHSGADALALRSWRPDVVFLDLGMPEMDGFEVARRMREDPRTADVVLVALTGWGNADDKRRCTDAGFDLHLTKPVDVATVLEVFARVAPKDS
ncbi:hybrid sensor histidine kinase/response regulator [Paraliomyxa miuraensis]|uniref:hybrid sensor histidine kinase/response regulator n=1 Tax=Paraliomyxa miuraensis TaxID=376150 RepID=UPI00225BAA11|nr:response regulator [Paraliomyxa miuraensis]MCX4247077.1 response regulator [Paraliomyxa miuraensis]